MLKSDIKTALPRQTPFFRLDVPLILCIAYVLYFNTLRAGLTQAVRKKTADSHVALRGNFSAPVCSTDPVKVSKNVASLVD